MSEERIATGVDRIERALARIAAAAGAPAMSAAPAPGGDAVEVESLRARHSALREEVAGALRELDEVLARG